MEMEKTGYLRVEKDKNKDLTRILWKKTLPEIYAAAIEPLPETSDVEEGLNHHPFMMMDGRKLNLPYFADLSTADADRIGKFYASVAR